MICCPSEKMLFSLVDGQLNPEDRKRLRSHLADCESCRSKFQELESIQALLTRRQRPQPSKLLFKTYRTNLHREFMPETPWSRAKQALESVIAYVFDSRPTGMRLIKAAALVMIGVFIGRLIFQPSSQYGTAPQSANIILLSTNPAEVKFMNDFCTQSEIWLLAVVNMPPAEEADKSEFVFNKEIAQKLLLKTSLMDDKIRQIDNDNYSKFINSIELLLLEAANASDERMTEVTEEIKFTIESSNLLYEARQFREMLKTLSSDV